MLLFLVKKNYGLSLVFVNTSGFNYEKYLKCQVIINFFLKIKHAQ